MDAIHDEFLEEPSATSRKKREVVELFSLLVYKLDGSLKIASRTSSGPFENALIVDVAGNRYSVVGVDADETGTALQIRMEKKSYRPDPR